MLLTRTTVASFTFDRCCQDGSFQQCFDEVTLSKLSCCRKHKHQCADLRLHVAAWSVPTYHEELDVEVASGELRCLGDDLHRDYFEDVRQHVMRNTLQAGILGTRVDKLVANLASSMSGCPEVSVLGKEAWAGRGFLKDNCSTTVVVRQPKSIP